MNDRKNFWIFENGIVGTSFTCNGLDLELEDLKSLENQLDSFLKSLPDNLRVRISLFQSWKKENNFKTDRSLDLEDRGFVLNKRLIHFENKRKLSLKEILFNKEEAVRSREKEILESLNNNFLEKLKSLPIKDFKEFYQINRPFKIIPIGLKTNKDFVGVLKLKNTSSHLISLHTLASSLENIPKPLEFHILFEKLGNFESDKVLKHKSKIEEEGRGRVAFEKYKESQLSQTKVILGGENLYRFEVHIVMRRKQGKHLVRDLNLAQRFLSSLGTFSEESVGALPSLKALVPSGNFHTKLLELSSVLKCFLPLYSFGQSTFKDEALTFQRKDLSLDSFNPFSPSYSNHSGIIIGKSGKGKSVFINLLVKALHFDNKAHIFLVDVKGSHTKTVRFLEGKTHNIDITNSCGLNPFRYLTTNKDRIEILSDFIEKLLLEDKEVSLDVKDKILLDQSLIKFSKSNTEKTLDHFYQMFNHPRKIHLSKWIKGSLNEFIFNGKTNDLNNRLSYFNFKNINTASNSQIGKAIIAAIMAEFSIKLLTKQPDEKLIFISDETPFFIKNSFQTFCLLSKNVRKLYGSLILVAQNSRDLIINNNPSLIDNSEFKFLFSSDGLKEKFMETFGLSLEEYNKIRNLQMIKGDYSSFLLKDSIGSRVGFLRLSKREYLRSNTDPEFLTKIQKLQSVLKINEDKALEVMSYV